MRRFSKAQIGAVLGTLLWIVSGSGGNAPGQNVRLSTWYRLNSVESSQWDRDFQAIADTGFTDVMLCWGIDAAAVAGQVQNTRRALDLCQQRGLKAYLLVWHPAYNKLPRQARFQQVDNQGNLLFTFNLFHRQWRSTHWKSYLQAVAGAYRDHAAFAGYLFDDTFYLGAAGSFAGDKTKSRGDFVSYSDYDQDQFRAWLRHRYGSLSRLKTAWGRDYPGWKAVEPPRALTRDNARAWEDWCAARLEWLTDWAADTVKYLRAADPASSHEILLEDGEYILGRERKSADSWRPITMRDSTGVHFGVVAKPFDAVTAYPAFAWAKTNAGDLAVARTESLLQELRAQVGDGKPIVYCFWVADADFRKPAGEFPNGPQIARVAEAALRLGVSHLSYYAYRIGDWRLTQSQWEEFASRRTPNYALAEPVPNRFLCDRPALRQQLKQEHLRLRSEGRSR